MHRLWCEAGYDPDAFWHQTPRTFDSAMKGAASRARRDAKAHQQIALNAAFQTAVMTRAQHPHQLLQRFENAIADDRRKTTIADRLLALHDAGTPMTITITDRSA